MAQKTCLALWNSLRGSPEVAPGRPAYPRTPARWGEKARCAPVTKFGPHRRPCASSRASFSGAVYIQCREVLGFTIRHFYNQQLCALFWSQVLASRGRWWAPNCGQTGPPHLFRGARARWYTQIGGKIVHSITVYVTPAGTSS